MARNVGECRLFQRASPRFASCHNSRPRFPEETGRHSDPPLGAALPPSRAFVTAPALHADITGYPSTNTNSGTTGAATVSSIGPNSRTWTLPPNTNLPAAIATNAALTNSHQLVELQTGMNFWDGSQWSPSVATFQTVSNGFAATQTQHKIFLNSQINTRSSVTVTTPDGTNLYSSPVAIALYDAASGNLAIIGTITNSSGVMVNSNQIAYPSAFAGVCADVVYTIERGALHQDVYLTGSINPADYNFPSNTTRIQIITELYNPPTPERIIRPVHVEQNQTVRAQMVTPDLIDEMLGFGHFTFGAGRAYMVPKATPQDAGAPVGKQLLNVNGRMLLVESVEYKSIWRGMAYLPQCNGGDKMRPAGRCTGMRSMLERAKPPMRPCQLRPAQNPWSRRPSPCLSPKPVSRQLRREVW